MKKQKGIHLDISEALDLLADELKVDRDYLRCQAEVHEKGYGHFYIVQHLGMGNDQYGLFTNDHDLTSIFKFQSCASNDKVRELGIANSRD